MVGPPGAGKSMLAKRLPSILPPMTREETLEASELHSVAGLLTDGKLLTSRPFRAPHHTISNVGLAGGGTRARPGELSLAHCGVLFLDELPEFSRSALEVLRQPLEDGVITISRASGKRDLSQPVHDGGGAQSLSLRAVWCGGRQMFLQSGRYCAVSAPHFGPPCSTASTCRWRVAPLSFDEISMPPAEPSRAIRERVCAARERQGWSAFGGTGIVSNSAMGHRQVAELLRFVARGKGIFERGLLHYASFCAQLRQTVQGSRTIADLAGADVIAPEHLAEAVQYRALDRKYWKR